MLAHASQDLVVDVGNTRMKLGLFVRGRLLGHRVAAQGDIAAVGQLLGGSQLDRVALGSVGSPDPKLLDALRRLAPVTEITGTTPAPVRSLYISRNTLGVDRLANVVGAALLFPRRVVLAIDLGSCATYDLVDELTVHRGGIIAPGLRMRARAMHAYSARLPEVVPPDDPDLIGTNTANCLESGVHHGMLMELQGHIASFRQQHRGMAVVITGGDAPRFAKALKSGIFAHPTLTLLGLHALLHYDPDHGPPSSPRP